MKAFNLKTLLFAVSVFVSAILNARTDLSADTMDLIIGNVVVITAGDNIDEQSNRYGVAAGSYILERTYGFVKVFSPDLYQSDAIGSINVDVDVYYETIDVDGNTSSATENKVLTLEASEDKVIDVAYFKVEGAQLIRATVNSVTVNDGPTWTDVFLETSVITDSYDNMSIAQPSINLRHDGGLNASGNLVVRWDDLSGAETYDLEWTYVSNQGEDEGSVKTPSQIEVDKFLFRNNSSRAEVKGNSYEIPMMYEKGYLLYRLRGRGKRIVNGVIVNSISEWTVPDGAYEKLDQHPSANRFLYDGLEQNLNWQSILYFAEDGKHKTQVSYHDGSLRNRQTVIRINTDERSVVGEVFYDYHGRPVVNVLPVPDTTDKLEYFKNFNLVDGQPMLQKDDYSIDEEGSGCEVKPFQLDDGFGASQYYSPSNVFQDSENNTGSEMINRNILPDAKKYPYIQTKYTPDNTGRIAAQGGVGEAYQIGAGHETEYSYGSAQQEELSRLFGNQVGYFLHYKKNVTVDANGQVSVIYKNLRGKVIASTLVGAPPANLDSIEGDTRVVVNNLFGGSVSSNMLGVDGKSKNYTNKFTVPERNTYTFDYNADVAFHDVFCVGEEGNATFQGVVDLDIKLIDGCGEVVFTAKENTVKGYVSATQNLSNTNVVELQKGEYVLSKELTINEEALEEYWQEYLGSSPTCVQSFDSLRRTVIDGLDLFGCNLTCEDCEAEIQRRIDADPGLSDEEEDAMWSLCDGICDKEVGCTAHINMMLGDMSPGGQYAKVRIEKLNIVDEVKASVNEDGEIEVEEVDVTIVQSKEIKEDGEVVAVVDAEKEDDNNFNPSIYELSIFNEYNNIPLSIYTRSLAGSIGVYRPSWQLPINIDVASFTKDNYNNQVIGSHSSLEGATYSYTDYMDENGDTVYAYITISVIDGVFDLSPLVGLAGLINAIPVQIDDLGLGIYKTPIKYLLKAEDFVKYWQPHFARYLLPYHPEYGYLVDCSENYRTSNDFDYKLTKTTTIDMAIEEGFIENKSPNIIRDTKGNSLDPFLQASDVNYDYMKARNDNFEGGYSMAEAATNAVNCSRTNLDVNCPVLNCFDGKIDTDEEWILYRSYYLSEKNMLIREQATQKAIDNYYYNVCIGEKEFTSNPGAGRYLRKWFDYDPVTVSTCTPTTINDEGIQNWSCSNRLEAQYWFWILDNKVTFWQDPRQTCNAKRFDKFEEKSKRFFIDNAESGMPKNCENVSESGGVTTVVPKVCADDLIEAVNESLLDAQRYRYETCGVCPIADDLNNFLYDLIRNDKLVSPEEEHLTCSEDKIHLQNELYRVLALVNTDIGWVSTVSADGKTLNGKFIFGGSADADDTVALTLTIPALPLGATFNNLSKLCCFKAVRSAPAPNAGKLFTLEGTSLFPFPVKFEISGFIDFASSLEECSITPRCLVTKEAENIATFLNALAYAGTASDESHLSKNSGSPFAIELMPNPRDPELAGDTNEERAIRRELYNGPIRSIFGFDKADIAVANGENYVTDDSLTNSYRPNWYVPTEVTDYLLEGYIIYVENATLKAIPITLSSETAVDFSQIIGFSRLRPYPGDGNEHKFYADALTNIGNLPSENEFVEITVETSTIITTACFEPTLPPDIEN